MNDAAPVTASCRKGHSGMLCHRCETGWGRAGEDECELCQNAFSMAGIAKFVAVVVSLCFVGCLVLIGVSFAIGEVYETEVANAIGETPNPMLDVRELQRPQRASYYQGMSNTKNPIYPESPEDEPEPKPRTMLEDTDRPASQDNHTAEEADSRVVSINATMRTCKRLLFSGVAVSIQPAKLVISYVQIIGHVGAVLHFQFPPVWAKVITIFRPLVANIRGTVALECAGLTSFYHTWLVEVIAIPATLLIFLCGWYIYRAKNEGATVALSKFFSEAFFLLFLVYPFVSNKL